MKTKRNWLSWAIPLLAGAVPLTTQGDLIHRYSFSETSGTTVRDSVGSANGELKGNGGYFTGSGQLVLPGGGASADPPEVIAGYVDLPNHIINVLDKVTIETWVTWEGAGPWQRIFDFGTSAGGEEIVNGFGNYLFLSPQGPDNLRFAVRDPATGNELTQLTALARLQTFEPVCITVTYDPGANIARLYSNAVMLVTGPAPVALRDINDVNNWLGRSQWNDAMFQGSYDEFRIYNTALDPLQVAASFAAGKDSPSTDPAALGALNAVTLHVPNLSMVEQDSQTVWGTAEYANFPGLRLSGVAGVTITSSNDGVVTVNAAGVATSVAPGTATLTLSYSGRTDSKTITVLPRQAGIAIAGKLWVDLRAEDVRNDTSVWRNRTGEGDFFAVGSPTYVANVNGTGVAGVQFNPVAPATDAYEGPMTTEDLHGSSDCSIEVWAYNPAIADEETLVAWSRRGGPDGSNRAFNYGANPTYGAVGHWGAPDMGWSGTPAAGQWHYLVYTFDGVNTAKVYADGILKTTEILTLNTHPDLPIRLAAQANTAGSDFDFGQALSGYLALVRVHGGKLTDADVANNFLFGPTLSPPGDIQSVQVRLDRPTLTGVRDLGQARVIVDFANLKNVDLTGFSTLASGNPDVVTVNAAGTYTAVGLGSTEIRATYRGLTVSAPVTVVAPPPLALKHRYSFGEPVGSTTVKDSVGSADGTIMGNGAAFDGAGQLILPGGGGSAAAPDVIAGYVNLPNGIISALANVSFEAWVTWDATASSWQRIFDFGTSAGGEDIVNGNGNYLFLSPQGPDNLRFAVRDPRTGTEPTQLTAAAPLAQGQKVYVAVSYDYNNNSARLYRDAVQVASGPAAVPLHLIDDVNNWLGRSQWNDAMFQGSYDEFRIWEGALSAEQVAANFAAGPNTIPEPPVEAPSLAIERSGNSVIVSWPGNATGFALQVASSVAGPWSPVDTSGAVEQAGRKRLTLPIGSSNQYYRMRK
ncbi:MAG: hypothetical protein IPM17_17365 [Verrucomicrobia bacterium]|nr:hypothetical protein [Verrucomicrobiota bacterium]